MSFMLGNNVDSNTSYQLYLTGSQQSQKSPLKLSHRFLASGLIKSVCNTPNHVNSESINSTLKFQAIKKEEKRVISRYLRQRLQFPFRLSLHSPSHCSHLNHVMSNLSRYLG